MASSRRLQNSVPIKIIISSCVAIAQVACAHGLSSDLGEVLRDRVRWGPVTWPGW